MAPLVSFSRCALAFRTGGTWLKHPISPLQAAAKARHSLSVPLKPAYAQRADLKGGRLGESAVREGNSGSLPAGIRALPEDFPQLAQVGVQAFLCRKKKSQLLVLSAFKKILRGKAAKAKSPAGLAGGFVTPLAPGAFGGRAPLLRPLV